MKRHQTLWFAAGFTAAVVLFASLYAVVAVADGHLAEERAKNVVVWATLSIEKEEHVEAAAKLLQTALIPTARETEGLDLTVLRLEPIPGMPQPDSDAAATYVMMAEMSDIRTFMQLMTSAPEGMEAFGQQMRMMAGAPDFQLYEVLGSTKQEAY